jgi:hypothetical protein
MRKIYIIMFVALFGVTLAACAPADTSEADAAMATADAGAKAAVAEADAAVAEADAAVAALEAQVGDLQAQLGDTSDDEAMAGLEAQIAALQDQLDAASATAEAPQAAERTDGLPAYTGEPAELRMGWWGNDDRAARTLQVIELFQSAYPEITVMGEPNGGAGDHFQILDTQLAANNAPDIIQFGGNWPDYEQYLVLQRDFIF